MILDFIFPRVCIGCRRFGKYICENCKKKLIYVKEDLCPDCQRTSEFGMTHAWCKSPLDGVISIFEYKGFAKTFIKTIKYKLQFSVWNEMYPLIPKSRISFTHKQIAEPISLQSIPLHTSRLKIRGFNQVEPFEKYIHKITAYPISHILIRKLNTLPQASISSKKVRKENITGVFDTANRKDVCKSVILIDDVYTTGNTCKEAAKVLKKNGAEHVYAITLARG